MAHDCPDCGQACYCDGEDTWNDAAAYYCGHFLQCEDEPDYEDDYEEGWEFDCHMGRDGLCGIGWLGGMRLRVSQSERETKLAFLPITDPVRRPVAVFPIIPKCRPHALAPRMFEGRVLARSDFLPA